MSPPTPPESTPPESTPRSGERIAKLLARAGVASRREVERMIEDGRVKLDGTVLTTPATVLPNLKGVTVDDEPVRAAEQARLFAFHKPSGLITAERDPTGRPTIYTALRNALPPGTPRVMPVGRLDLNTEGLLLLTNDGELKRALELPSTGIPRTYRARTFGTVTQAQLEDLMVGVEIDGFQYGSINANMERSTGHNQWIELTLTEGKNREVRRVLEHLGLQVSRLLRLSYGPFHLADLPRGAAVEIRQVDVERFCKALKIPGAVAELPTHAVERASARPAPAPKPAPAAGRRGAARHEPVTAAPETRPRRGASDAPRRAPEEKPRRSFGDAARQRAEDKPRGTAGDPARRPLVDKPRRGFGDTPRRADKVDTRPGRASAEKPWATQTPAESPRQPRGDKPAGFKPYGEKPTRGPAGGRGKPSGFKPNGDKPTGGPAGGRGKPRPGGPSKPRTRT